jgi:hypothetical protein
MGRVDRIFFEANPEVPYFVSLQRVDQLSTSVESFVALPGHFEPEIQSSRP